MSPSSASLLPALAYAAPPDHGLDIVYLDAALLLVNKPTGLLSVPGRGEEKQDCLVRRIQSSHPEALIVHRLDMHTSGLLLLARGREMQRRLSIAFATRQVEKRYLAVVAGRPPSTSGEIDLPTRYLWLVGFTHQLPFFTLACLCGTQPAGALGADLLGLVGSDLPASLPGPSRPASGTRTRCSSASAGPSSAASCSPRPRTG
jgi:hypothetical protein